jgi:aspartyl-tRNA synthetase
MSHEFKHWKRTHNCGELREQNIGSSVILNGWVSNSRDLGNLIFLVLRDARGKTQVVIDGDQTPDVYKAAKQLRHEYVIAVKGTVRVRPASMGNDAMATGAIEVLAQNLSILNSCAVLPFPITDKTDASETLRLKYRYLDLRRDELHENILNRAKVTRLIRQTMEEHGFTDIETPFLYKSTPEGAREFLLPSRIAPGQFYALPQSPQLFKQILMIAGFDRYYQIVKCFRDEDLRADRQPEFTQLDCEMSFVDQEDVIQIFTQIISKVVNAYFGKNILTSIPRRTYTEVMEEYGVDKPDTRFDLKLQDLSTIVKGCEFKIFSDAVASGGIVNALCVPNQGEMTRKKLDELEEQAKHLGLKGLAWAKVGKESWQSSLTRVLSDALIDQINKHVKSKEGDLILIAAGSYDVVKAALGSLRNKLGKDLKLYDPKQFNFLWVVEFPLLERDAENSRWVAKHHPFTSPMDEDLSLLESDPGAVRAKAYDLVCNGYELGGGSIRIHNEEIQERQFRVLGMSREDAEKKFGFLLEALKYGAPPHGGVAFGLDRTVMVLTGCEAIRDIIPFPKTQKAACLMTSSPAPVPNESLKDLHIKLDVKES